MTGSILNGIPESLEGSFPFFLSFNDDIRLQALGPGLQKLLPQAPAGAMLTDWFRLRQPDLPLSPPLLERLQGKVLIIESRDGRFRLVGELFHRPSAGWTFLGTPCMTSVEELEPIGLTVSGTMSPPLVIGPVEIDPVPPAAEIQATTDSALINATALTRTILDTAVEAIITIDEEGRIVIFNPAAEKLFGYPANEIQNRNITLLMSSPHREKHDFYIQEYFRTGRKKMLGKTMETEAMHRDGHRFPVQITLGEAHLAHGRRFFTAFIRDLTARKQTELALEKAQTRAAEIGGKIQRTLLIEPPLRHLPSLQIAVLSVPSEEMSGDFVDFVEHPAGVDLLIGDVMGKGVPAALLGAATKNQFLRRRTSSPEDAARGLGGDEPAEIFNRVHGKLTPQMIRFGTITTACLARFDMSRRELRFVNAGHPQIIRYSARSGETEQIGTPDSPLGFADKAAYRQFSASFEPGDVFVFHSDGITNARNPGNQSFGIEGLLDLVRSHGQGYPQKLLNHLQSVLTNFIQSETVPDDLTCVVVRVDDDPGPVLQEAVREFLSDPEQLENMREFLREFLAAHAPAALPQEDLLAFELAVSEAGTNVMYHACGGLTTMPIRLRLALHRDRVRVHFFHGGKTFKTKVFDPPSFDGSRSSGFGLYLIDQGADEIRYLSSNGEQELRLGHLRADTRTA